MSIFNFVKARISIFDVVREYTNLKKAGAYWKARCPFHHEKTASFTISPAKEIFYCFGCHAGGDIIAFIAKTEQCSQLEAAKYLAERYNIELPAQFKISDTPDKTAKDQNNYFNLCKQVALWCRKNLEKYPSAKAYLINRGFNDKSIDDFCLGYFPGGTQSIKACIAYMKQVNILPHDLIEANILAESKITLYSPFEDRIIFPIRDHLGRFCGFGGRTIKPDDRRPKYYNSHENDYFIKRSLLFGLDGAKKRIQETGKVFLVEGYTDCVAMVQKGFVQTVATLGTACTSDHLKHLSRYAQYLYVLYDNDNAGHQAILRLTELCWQVNIEVKVISLPSGLDPASFLQKKNDLEPYINQAKDIFLFFIESLGQNFAIKSLHEKIMLTRRMTEILNTIDDQLKQDILLQKASKVFDIPFKALKQELERQTQKQRSRASGQQPSENQVKQAPKALDHIPKLEKMIFCGIMNNVQIFNKLKEKYLIDYMPGPLKTILKQLEQLKDSDASINFTQFFDTLDQQNKQYVSNLLLQYDQITSQELEQLLVQLQKRQWKVIVRTIKQRLAQAKTEGNEKKVKQILNDFLALKQKIIAEVTQNNQTVDK